MTYSDAIARGEGTWEAFARIDGCRYVLGTAAAAPSDSWYSDENFSYLRGMRFSSVEFGCDAHPGEVWPETKGADLEFDDGAGTLRTHVKAIEALNVTELTETLVAGATTINVVSTVGFDSSGVVYVGREAIAYSGVTATSFTGCTRGYYGSVDADHVYDVNVVPACVPEVTDGPVDLLHRRVVIYAAEVRNGVMSATEQVWVGWVSAAVDMTSGTIRIPVSHVLDAFAEGTVFNWVPTGRLRGLYVPNYDGLRWGRMRLNPETSAGGSWVDLDVVTDETAEFFESAQDLIDAWVADVNALTDWRASQAPDGRLVLTYSGSGEGTVSGNRSLGEVLGFTGGGPHAGLGTTDGQLIAADMPCSTFTACNVAAAGWEPRLYLREDEADWFVESYCRLQVEGQDPYLPIKIFEVDGTNDYLVVQYTNSFSSVGEAISEVGIIYTRGDEPPPRVVQAWGLNNFGIHEVVRLLWSGETYAGAAAIDYTAPARWRVGEHLVDGDVDWAELERLVAAVPPQIRTMAREISEPTEVSKVLTGQLLACGIYAYVKNDGTVGWQVAHVPTSVGVTGTVTASNVDGKRGPQTTTKSRKERLMNVAVFDVESVEEEKRELVIADQQSLQRYGGQPARDMRDPLGPITKRAAKLEIKVTPGVIHDWNSHAEEVARHMASTVIGLLARPRPIVQLPVTPGARTHAIGDVVLLTTRWAHDTMTGTDGVSSKIAMVLGWDRSFSLEERTDYLTLMMIDSPPGAISPAALATSWVAGTRTLTFADTDIYHRADDDTDLDWLEAGASVVDLVEHDSESPTVWADQDIESVNTATGTVVLKAPVAIGIAAPCVVRLANYSDSPTAQQGDGWIWIADDADWQVEDARVGWRWA